ncbi:substrate-binding domain-containing protein [uncultured Phascolarctobacterium sp.]|uniref:sugar ABC transporter substrate-binding protein n=1 Tax=Phascolarctobacterium sp. TaxID=2049039 RepID=UPI0025E6E0DF|nr:substrate-binding domain-containing protein [uncultured Phascolarctobacterium sp.]
MLKKIVGVLCILVLVLSMAGCSETLKKPKIGVSFGVGGASRWPKEKIFMELRAQELGADIDVRFNTGDKPTTQDEDCKELIDSGIDVLILIPRDVRKIDEVLTYAKKKNVKIISYTRAVLDQRVDLFIGYDTYKIGQNMGKHLAERVYKGNFIILKGDKGDFNTELLYTGAKKYIEPMVGSGVTIILDDYVPGWSADRAKAMVIEAALKNGNKIDAILTPNDGLAGGAAAAVAELGLKNNVVITGMDAELPAVKRIVDGKQDMTVYMDLKSLAATAVDKAYAMARGEKVTANAELDAPTGEQIKAYLITGKMVTKENLDKTLIETNYYTKEQVYGVGGL